MRIYQPSLSVLLTILSLTFASCAQLSRQPEASVQDDDAFCRSGGVAQGSPAYAQCRKERDGVRIAAANRADRAQRNLGEYMLNNPDRPAR